MVLAFSRGIFCIYRIVYVYIYKEFWIIVFKYIKEYSFIDLVFLFLFLFFSGLFFFMETLFFEFVRLLFLLFKLFSRVLS